MDFHAEAVSPTAAERLPFGFMNGVFMAGSPLLERKQPLALAPSCPPHGHAFG